MMHIIKWKAQEHQRSRSWTRTIRNARREIREIQESTPSITNEIIRGYWDKAFVEARADAEDEMEQRTNVEHLTWQEVFDDEYVLPFPTA
jgi:hypothetical protein